MNKCKQKRQQGITLIALVITILVLLILAGVSITALTDEDKGVVSKAKEASEKTASAAKKEDDDIGEILNYVGDEDVPTGGNTTIPEEPEEPEEPEVVIEGKLVDLVTAENYGDTINYISPNGITAWKIYYNDGENVFIMASDYLLNDYLPAEVKMETLDEYPYSAFWPQNTTTLNDIAGSQSIDSAIADKYLLDWVNDYPTSTNANIKAVAALLDSTVWDDFVNPTYADSAIGSSTLDMFIESWNEKYSDAQIYYDVRNEYGYYVTAIAPANRTEAITSTFIYLSQKAGYSNSLYFPAQDTDNGCNGYWLASPSTFLYNDQTAPAYVYHDGTLGASQAGCCGTGSMQTAGADLSARPVVCMNTDVEVTYVNGQWYLK